MIWRPSAGMIAGLLHMCVSGVTLAIEIKEAYALASKGPGCVALTSHSLLKFMLAGAW